MSSKEAKSNVVKPKTSAIVLDSSPDLDFGDRRSATGRSAMVYTQHHRAVVSLFAPFLHGGLAHVAANTIPSSPLAG